MSLMDLTVVHALEGEPYIAGSTQATITEDTVSHQVSSSSPNPQLTIAIRPAVKSLALLAGDAVAALLAAAVLKVMIPVPSTSYFRAIDSLYVLLALAYCLFFGLYDRSQSNPLMRLRMRLQAVLAASLVELLVVSLKLPVASVFLYIAARGALFFILGFYLEYGTTRRFSESHCAFLAQPFHAGQPLPDWIKRVADVIVALIAGFFSLPLMAAATAAVRLFDPGPVFYSQKRIGQGGKRSKFSRSGACMWMRSGASNAG